MKCLNVKMKNMKTTNELYAKVENLISRLEGGQNPAWTRPDDKEIIDILCDVAEFLYDFSEIIPSQKERLSDLCDSVYEEIHDAVYSAEHAIDKHKKLQDSIYEE